MAMLAEPRKKQKFSIDPRNLNWSNDESKVGQKMLEKMGWSKGKGLGASEQGEVDHITVRAKNDVKGVGCTNTYADTWIAHQDDFNSLLANLNADHSGSGTNTPDPDKVASLENSSKASKSRLHYGKYTRGKDLSTRGADELECIFGKKKKMNVEGAEETKVTSSSDDEDKDGDQNLITSSQSVADYFAEKMAALRRSRSGAPQVSVNASPVQLDAPDDMAADTETLQVLSVPILQTPGLDPGTDVQLLNTEDTTCTNPSRSKKKKKKKNKTDTGEVRKQLSDTQDTTCTNLSRSKKKKNKTDTGEVGNQLSDTQDTTCTNLSRSKKKKKKKNKTDIGDDEKEEENGVEVVQDQECSLNEQSSTTKSEVELSVEITSKEIKKKKKKKCKKTHKSEPEESNRVSNSNEMEIISEEKKSISEDGLVKIGEKKSKKKRKHDSDLDDKTGSKKVRTSTGNSDATNQGRSKMEKRKDKNSEESSTSARYVIEKKTGKKIFINDLQLDKKFVGSNLLDIAPYGSAT